MSDEITPIPLNVQRIEAENPFQRRKPREGITSRKRSGSKNPRNTSEHKKSPHTPGSLDIRA